MADCLRAAGLHESEAAGCGHARRSCENSGAKGGSKARFIGQAVWDKNVVLFEAVMLASDWDRMKEGAEA